MELRAITEFLVIEGESPINIHKRQQNVALMKYLITTIAKMGLAAFEVSVVENVSF